MDLRPSRRPPRCTASDSSADRLTCARMRVRSPAPSRVCASSMALRGGTKPPSRPCTWFTRSSSRDLSRVRPRSEIGVSGPITANRSSGRICGLDEPDQVAAASECRRWRRTSGGSRRGRSPAAARRRGRLPDVRDRASGWRAIRRCLSGGWPDKVTAWNSCTRWTTPSSRTSKSSCVRPVTGMLSRPITLTSTRTAPTPTRNVGGCGGAAGGCCAAGPVASRTRHSSPA